MSVLGIVLGAITLFSTLGTVAMVRLMEMLRRRPEAANLPKLPPYMQAGLAFSMSSSVVVVPLSVALIAAAIATLRAPASGRRWFITTAWAWVAGTVILALLWDFEAAKTGAELSTRLGGAALQLLQAALIARAAWFLMREDVKTACAG